MEGYLGRGSQGKAENVGMLIGLKNNLHRGSIKGINDSCGNLVKRGRESKTMLVKHIPTF